MTRSLTDRLKRRQWILDVGNVDRIHIVGAARSGTTMLHYSLAAFEDVVLHDEETNPVWSPTTQSSIRMAVANRLRGGRTVYVTKRNYGWYRDHLVRMVARDVQQGGVGLINIVRDPRDAMTSFHSDGMNYYLEPDRWLASVVAAESLFEQLAAHERKLTIRYEDVVRDPVAVQRELEQTLGLRLRAGLTNWAGMADNLARLGQAVGMQKALHSVRNFDPSSVGGWRRDPAKVSHVTALMRDPEHSHGLRRFMDRHGYDDIATD